MKTELLSPAGNIESLKSAIHHGADAVYLGGTLFSARSQANNFDNEQIIDAINYAHLYDVKVYVTVNTLIKEKEFDKALAFIEMLYLNNVDGVIVQDMGLASVIIEKYPLLNVHASTQMNVQTVEEAMFLKKLGFKRIILGRECPIETIRKIKKEVDIEVEVFIHGALCMSYSGNCYMSSIIGKRSGNRGKCAQPCRLLYSLNDDKKESYLLSTKDLMTLDYLDQLLDINIDSLKIEGRMKRPEYVALITEIYKEKINSYYNKTQFNDETKIKEMKEMFNREFTKGYMFHENNKDFTNTAYSNHIGVSVGKVIKVDRNYIYVKLTDDLENHDSIRIAGKVVDAVTISEMYINNTIVKKAHKGDTVKIRCHKELTIGANVLKTTTISLMNRLSNYEEKKLLIDGFISIKDNKLCLKVKYKDIQIEELSSKEVEKATSIESERRILEQIAKTNSSIYKFKTLEINAKNAFLPVSIINELRRNVLEKLTETRLTVPYKPVKEFKSNDLTLEKISDKVYVQVETKEQYEEVRKIYNGIIWTENENIKNDDNKLWYLNPRTSIKIQDGGIQSFNALGSNHLFTSVYMNVFNSYSMAFLYNHGIKLIGLSFELSSDELKETIDAFKNRYNVIPNTYLMVYGRYELMIMKHCLINKYEQCTHLNCKKCLEKQYYLKDRLGFKFPLIKTNNCNLKLLNSKIVNLINNVDEINKDGINGILISFTIETKEEIEKVLKAYIDKINGKNTSLKINDVTYGHFNEGIL